MEKCLENRNSVNDVVIDPFLGCGTTLVTAKNMGFSGIGFDRHPVFYNLAVAKLGNYTHADLERVKNKLLSHNESMTWDADARTFLEKLFSNEDLDIISRASYAVNAFHGRLKPLAIALFLKSCEAACGAQTDGIYKAPSSLKKKIPFRQAVEAAYLVFEEDIDTHWYTEHWCAQPEAKFFNKSSTNLCGVESDSIGICITSPPYLNNFDYAEMTRMHLYLLGWAGSWREISTSIRNNLITNTTTALKGKKGLENQMKHRSSLPEVLLGELDAIVLDLEKERKTRAGKKDYDYLVYPYYSEIRQVLSEIFRCLKSGGEIHWVVADAALTFLREDEYSSISGVVYDFRADFVLPNPENPIAFIEVRKSSSRHASLYAKDKMFSAINWKGKHKNIIGVIVVEGEWTQATLRTMASVFDYVVPLSKSTELAKILKCAQDGDKSVLKWLIQFSISPSPNFSDKGLTSE